MLSSGQTRRYWNPPCRGPWASVRLHGGGLVMVRPATVEAVKALNQCLIANNYKTRSRDTGGFACRRVKGTSSVSLHAYGLAIDINWQCLSGDTQIVTVDGLRTLRDVSGTTQTLLTMDPIAQVEPYWVEAPIIGYGDAEVMNVELHKNAERKNILATKPHTWWVVDDDGHKALMSTQELEPGTQILNCSDTDMECWQVHSVTSAGVTDVYCPHVEETGTFALEDNILTGNSNPYMYRLVTDMPRSLPASICAIRTNNGAQVWQWGGYWSGKKDCLVGDTRVVTKDGPRTISELVGMEVELLSTHGDPLLGETKPEWVKAPVRSYGFDTTYTVTLKRKHVTTSIKCTSNHRWPVQTKEGIQLVETKDLMSTWQDNFNIPAIQYPTVEEPWEIDPLHVAKGIVWGDGSQYNTHGSRTPRSKCQLCQEKKELKQWLDNYAGYWSTTNDGITAWKMPNSLKSLPDLDATLAEKISFFMGWFATDGCIKSSVPSLSTSNIDALRWINQEAANLGLTITSVGKQEAGKSGFTSTKDNYTILFRHIPKSYYLRSSHQKGWQANDKYWFGWKLQSVEVNEDVEEVFCATVHGRGVFALDTPSVPLLTGNSMHYQVSCKPSDLASGINWRTVPGNIPAKTPSLPAPPQKQAPKPPPISIPLDEGDDYTMRLFRDHTGKVWILTGRDRKHVRTKNEYKALKGSWIPNHDIGPGSPFYNPILSQVILNYTREVK